MASKKTIIKTPTKIYFLKKIEKDALIDCRLCTTQISKKNCKQIFSNIGKSNLLQRKISCCCGVNTSENDLLSVVICRNCDLFINKIWNFRIECDRNQTKEIHTKRLSNEWLDSLPNSKKKLIFKNNTSELNIQISKNLKHIYPKVDESKQNFSQEIEIPLSIREQQQLISSIRTSIPSTVANTLSVTPSILALVKKKILADLSLSCKKLCCRTNSSVLYNKSFSDMTSFDMEKLWIELKKHPLLVNVLDAITGHSR
jgi:hypothetical protein